MTDANGKNRPVDDWRLRARRHFCGMCIQGLHAFCAGRAWGCPCDHLDGSDG